MKKIIFLLLSCNYLASGNLPPFTEQELNKIGARIWKNESAGKISGLTVWNLGEEFASLGIGHFIWYPDNVKKNFKESFPHLIEYLEKNGQNPPKFIEKKISCPWKSREEFQKEIDSSKMEQLREFLAKTIGLQVKFIVERLERNIPALYQSLPMERRKNVERQFSRLCATPQGIFVLVDYLNFKGEGTSPLETYDGKGWGLLQVLETMAEGSDEEAISHFVAAAKKVLEERVEHSPSQRNEKKWLAGWNNRLESYLQPY